MATMKERAPRRSDALSRGRIVDAAVEVLDAEGEGKLMLALTARLSTGAGAIYHHVAGKGELLAAATDEVIAGVMARAEASSDPRRSIRAMSLGIFDAIDAHPWVGTQLSREPSQPAVLRIWEGIGQRLRDLGVAAPARADAGYALVNYILGAAAQYAAGPRSLSSEADRTAYLAALAARWTQRSSAENPDVHEAAALLREHDDRKQFLAGVDIFLAGATTAR